MALRVRSLAVIALLALPAGLAACGGGRPSATQSGSPTPSSSPSASPTPVPSPAIGCTIVTPDEINAALGTQVGLPEVTHNQPQETDCVFNGPSQLVTVDIVVGENASGFAADRQEFTAQCGTSADAPCTASATVTGVGEQAYYLTGASPEGTTLTLLALQNNVSYLVSAQTAIGPLEALMKQLLSQGAAIPVPSPS